MGSNSNNGNKTKKKNKKRSSSSEKRKSSSSDNNEKKRAKTTADADTTIQSAADGISDDDKKRDDSLNIKQQQQLKSKSSLLPFDYKYICAPMVGASELPFRLLCRKYGCQLVYTPMMIASEFVNDKEYRKKEFQTTTFDRPLVCHFAASTPQDFANAAKLVESDCDAIDLNLGCPQRTAYVGHFGSYLLDKKDRQLILDIIKAGVNAVSIPIFVKIRLLDTIDETIELVTQLYNAGATLIAIHGRYRASYERKGPGARDGPALLDQIRIIKEKACPSNKILITNGNTITYDDVINNLKFTNADGIMSAEGILDNPALYLERYNGSNRNSRDIDNEEKEIHIKGGAIFDSFDNNKKKKKYIKKLQQIDYIKSKQQQQQTTEIIDSSSSVLVSDKEKKKLSKESKIRQKLIKLDNDIISKCQQDDNDDNNMAYSTTTLSKLYETADDKTKLAKEYMQLSIQYPTTLRTIIFHTRRILKQELITYQLMEDCLSSKCINDLIKIVEKISNYQNNTGLFQYDIQKAKQEKETLERKKQEEGKRKAYEARMIRKAKREGKLSDLDYYLRQGTEIPTIDTIQKLKTMTKEKQLLLWKQKNHSQHCMVFHLQDGNCPRGRSCAFLHTTTKTSTTFDEKDEVAG